MIINWCLLSAYIIYSMHDDYDWFRWLLSAYKVCHLVPDSNVLWFNVSDVVVEKTKVIRTKQRVYPRVYILQHSWETQGYVVPLKNSQCIQCILTYTLHYIPVQCNKKYSPSYTIQTKRKIIILRKWKIIIISNVINSNQVEYQIFGQILGCILHTLKSNTNVFKRYILIIISFSKFKNTNKIKHKL